MYICPVCDKGFKDADAVAKHSLSCWRAHNPNHKSKLAPCKGNTTERQINEDISDFFTRFELCQK